MSDPALIGPYRIQRTLGEGGMGVVYLAEDPADGVTVAVKTVLVPQATLLHNIRREILALARLSHPGIVRILSHGIDGGVPWYAMELARGVTLRDALGRPELASSPTPTAPLGPSRATLPIARPAAFGEEPPRDVPREQAPPEAAPVTGMLSMYDAISVVARLCVPLRYLHGEGLVHRDLKPENVLLRADGSPLLIDFGLTSAFGGREEWAVHDGGEMAGTVSYIAPEQAAGRDVDARADLYALGCVLYELLTGRPPFLGTAIEVIQQHLAAEPAPPSRHVAGIPTSLDAVVLRMLEKDPAHRHGYADDVAAALVELGAEQRPVAEAPPPRLYLYRPAFVGHAALLRDFDARLRAARGGSGSLFHLAGETGIGKTRLALELARRATERGMLVLSGQCEPDGGRPLEALRRPLQAIADLCRERGLAATTRIFGPRAKILASYEPALGSLPGQEQQPDPEPLAGRAGRNRVIQALAETFAELAAERPLFLVIDDAQWCDELTEAVLDAAMRLVASRKLRVVVAVAYRKDDASDVVARLARREGPVVDIPRLDRESVASMAGSMLAMEEVPSGVVDDLARDTEGIPLFVAEYLRAAAERALVTRDGKGRWRRDPTASTSWRELAIPRTVQELVEGRMKGLSLDARHVLACCAVLGRATTADLLVRTAGIGDTALEQLQELERRQVLEIAGPELRFQHQKLREVILKGISRVVGRTIHRAAAEAVDALPAAERAERLGALGAHWELADDHRRAAACYLEAARRAGSAFALAEAERLYRAYLAVAGSDAATIEPRLELAERVLFVLARFSEAEAEAERALGAARAAHAPALVTRALRILAVMRAVQGALDESRALLLEAEAQAGVSGNHQELALVLRSLANVDVEQGRLEDACRRFEQALEIQRGGGEDAEAAMTAGNLGVATLELGRDEEAEALFREAIAMHERSGRKRSAAIMSGNLALALRGLGRDEEAEALLESALATHRAIGDRASEATVLTNVATGRIVRECYDEALPYLESSIAIHRDIGNRRSEAIALTNLAQVRVALGEAVEARALLEAALGIVEQLGERRLLPHVREMQAMVALEQGEADAGTVVDEARQAWRKSGSSDGEASLLLRVVPHLRRCRRRAEARSALLEATTLLQGAGGLHLAEARSLLADLEREAGDLEAAAAHAGEASALLEALPRAPIHGVHALVLARLAAARGEAPDEELARARALRAELRLGSRSRLAREIAAFDAGARDPGPLQGV